MDEQLDHPKDIGFGTLRSTLYHILATEEIWLERWTEQPWRPYPTDPAGRSVEQIREGLQVAAKTRHEMIDDERSGHWAREVKFLDSKKNEYQYRLADLLTHVANHGIHHRAQALNFLRDFERTIPAGIDYAFYRLARGNTPQEPSASEAMQKFGLAVNEIPGSDVEWNPVMAKQLFAYSDWAVDKVIRWAESLNDSQLDKPFDMGLGSVRKTLCHLHDAENWWIGNWSGEPGEFPHSPENTSLKELVDSWQSIAQQRNQFIDQLDAESAQQMVVIKTGGPQPTSNLVNPSFNWLGMAPITGPRSSTC